MYDLCIIGGGAAGMACAITAARRGLKCIIIEKEAKLGKKLYATGNGRCNITNRHFVKPYYIYYNSSYSDYSVFLDKLYNKKNPDIEVIDFVNSIGIYTYDINSYVYPQSLQASSVMWALNDEIKKLNIDVRFKALIDKIEYSDGKYELKVLNEQIDALNLVLACGGASYKSLGGSGIGYTLCKSLGIECVPLRPSLCGLVTKEDIKILKGVRIKARAKLFDGGYKAGLNAETEVSSEDGELQFTDYGISGIMIFNLSGKAGKLIEEGKKPYIVVDFLPDTDDKIIFEAFEKFDNRKPEAVLNSFVNEKLAAFIINEIKALKTSYEIGDIVKKLHNFKLEINSLTDFENAQVTAGGISLDNINPDDMSIRSKEGLYAIGELTDIDGICGGYNLTYAIISGIRAGENINDTNKSDKA